MYDNFFKDLFIHILLNGLSNKELCLSSSDTLKDVVYLNSRLKRLIIAKKII